MRIGSHNRLSFRQAKYVVLIGLSLGLLVSSGTIGLDLMKERKRIKSTVNQVVSIVRGQAAQATYNLNKSLARNIVNGLFAYQSICEAKLIDDFGTVLAHRVRPTSTHRFPWLVSAVFGGDLTYSIPLFGQDGKTPLGRIVLTLDGYLIGRNFLNRSAVLIFGEVIRNLVLAGILGLLLYYSITRPLLGISRTLSAVDPARPDERLLPIPKGHERDELGELAKATNQLLTELADSITQCKAAELRVQLREVYIRSIMDNVPDCILTVDEDGWVESCNPAAAKLFGTTREQLVGQRIEWLVAGHEDHPLVTIDATDSNYGDGHRFASAPCEAVAVRMDGTSVPVELRLGEMHHHDRHLAICVMNDISDRRQAEEALREAHERFLTVLDSIDADIYVADMETHEILFMNRHKRDSFGRDLVGDLCWRAFRGKEGPCSECTNPRLLDSRGESTGVWVWEGRNPITNNWYINYDRAIKWVDGRYVRLQAATDITDRVQAEEALRRQNEYLAALHETSLGLMSRLDLNDLLNDLLVRATTLARVPHGFIDLWDPKQQVLVCTYGCGVFAELIGRRVKPGEGLVGRVWNKGEPLLVANYWNWQNRLQDTGLSCLHNVLGVPLRSGEHIAGVLGLGHAEEGETISEDQIRLLERFAELATIALDNARLHTQVQQELSERKRLELERETMEAQLRQAQKMEAIGTLAGGIAHDFNNILAAIMGYAEMAQFDIPAGNPARRSLKQILKASHRAKDLVRQILEFSRQSDEKRKPVQLDLIVKEALKLLKASLPSTIEMRTRIAANGCTAMADPTQIHQVVMNLATNAHHAMLDRGGILEVELSTVDLSPGDTAAFTGLDPGEYLRLTVSDTGHGIDPITMDRIFDPYFTTKAQGVGTGMGLAVVHGIVTAHGGEITVSSEPGRGTRFDVLLPRIHDDVKHQADAFEPLPTGRERILFIDDEEFLADVGKHTLERLGYQVEATTQPRAALAAFRAEPHRFDLVITDMTMPLMTGEQLARELLRIRPSIPVILCTGFSHLITEEKAYAIGIQGFLMKPLSVRDMAKTVRRVLDRQGGRSVDPSSMPNGEAGTRSTP